MTACRTCDERVLEFVYAELDPGERSRFEEHLQSSPDCARALGTLQEVERATRKGLAAEEPSPALLAGLKAEARKQVAELRASRDRHVRLSAAEPRSEVYRDPRPFAVLRAFLARTVAVPVWMPALGALVLVAAASLLAQREGRLEAPPAPLQEEQAAAQRPAAPPVPPAKVTAALAAARQAAPRVATAASPDRRDPGLDSRLGHDVLPSAGAGDTPPPAPAQLGRRSSAPEREVLATADEAALADRDAGQSRAAKGEGDASLTAGGSEGGSEGGVEGGVAGGVPGDAPAAMPEADSEPPPATAATAGDDRPTRARTTSVAGAAAAHDEERRAKAGAHPMTAQAPAPAPVGAREAAESRAFARPPGGPDEAECARRLARAGSREMEHASDHELLTDLRCAERLGRSDLLLRIVEAGARSQRFDLARRALTLLEARGDPGAGRARAELEAAVRASREATPTPPGR